MRAANERITLRQLQILLLVSALGTGLITLPRRVASYTAQDGWLIVLGLTVLGMALAVLITLAARIKPGATFIGYTSYALTKPVAYLCALLLWVKLLLSAGLELRGFLLITRQVLLPETPMGWVSGLMLFTCAYAAAKGIETRARVAEILVWLLLVPLAFLFIIALMNIDLRNLQPVLAAAEPRALLTGTLRLGFIFTGLECLLVAAPFIANNKRLPRAAAGAVGVAGLVITVITVLTLAKFGPGVTDEPWPVLRMMDMLPLPGAFIERQEALIFGFWIITVFSLVSAMIFFGGRLLHDMAASLKPKKPEVRHKRKYPISVFITAAAVFGITFFPWDAAAVEERLDILYYTGGVFFLVLFPLAVLAGAALRKVFAKKLRRNAHKAIILVLLLFFPFTLSGCYDRVEIDNRLFVTALAPDTAPCGEGHYTLTVLTARNSTSDNDDENTKIVTATGQTLTEAMHKLDEKTNTPLYYGLAKRLVLCPEVLTDAARVQAILQALLENPEIDRKIQIFTFSDGDTVNDNSNDTVPTDTDSTNTDPTEAPPTAVSVMKALTEELQGREVFTTDLNTLRSQIKDNGVGLIPVYGGGAVVLKAYEKALTLTPTQMRGYLWCVPKMKIHPVTNAPGGEGFMSFTTRKHDVKVKFLECDANNPQAPLCAVINVYVKGTLAEAAGTPPDRAKELIAAAIAEEIKSTIALLQANNLDAHHWRECLRQKHYDLYKRYGPRWDEIFPQIILIPRVQVELYT